MKRDPSVGDIQSAKSFVNIFPSIFNERNESIVSAILESHKPSCIFRIFRVSSRVAVQMRYKIRG